jgi:hypothetical protein
MADFDDWSGDRGMHPDRDPFDAPLLSGRTFPGVPDPVAGHLHVADYRSEGHGSGLINFTGARFAAHEIRPDKARRVMPLR